MSSTPPAEVRDHRGRAIRLRLVNLAAVLLPLAGFATAVGLLWGIALDWTHLAVLIFMYFATGLGITVGYHRLFTHRAFDAAAPVRYALGVMGSMAVQGPVIIWAAQHRRHHRHSDDEDDPHSPHIHGAGLLASARGFWHAHVGWMLGRPPRAVAKYVPDLRADAVARSVSRLFPLWVLLGLALPAALGGLLTLSWTGVLLGFLWGGLARVFLLHHITWSVNSVCHLWGTRPFRSHDESRNNPVLGLLAFGEGWHNNHHAFPASARHGLRWWEFDVSYLVIRLLEACHLATRVRVPSAERIAQGRARRSASDEAPPE